MQIRPGPGRPGDKLKIIGVTGANGKTTASCLIAGVLAHAGNKVGLLSKLGYFDGEDVEFAAEATPPPDRLAAFFARMEQNGCTYAVIEISNRAIEQSRVDGEWLDALCLTNCVPLPARPAVRETRLDEPTVVPIHLFWTDHYKRAGTRLFDNLRAEALVVLNADDPIASGYLHSVSNPMLTIGIDSAAEITGTPLEQCPSEQTFLITAGADTVPVRTLMIGRHHIYNCLAAAAAGLAYGVELPQIVRTLEAAGHVPGRLERIECGQPFSVFVDFAHTPDALAGCLQTLKTVTKGRLICVLGVGVDGNRSIRSKLGRVVEHDAELTIITSADQSDEEHETIIQDLMDGFQRPGDVEVIPLRRQAIHRALSMARKGDCVLIAGRDCPSMQIEDEDVFSIDDDRQIAGDWLHELQPSGEW